MTNFYIGLVTGLLISYLFFILSRRIERSVRHNELEKKLAPIRQQEPIKPDIETSINNIMEYNEDIALQDIKKRRG